MTNPSREQRGEQIEKYLSQRPDATLKQIGNFLGVSKQRAHIVLKGLGILTRYQRNKQLASKHEVEILQYIASGNNNEQLAAIFGVSGYTMARQVRIILAKLKAKNRAQAVMLARQQGLISLDRLEPAKTASRYYYPMRSSI